MDTDVDTELKMRLPYEDVQVFIGEFTDIGKRMNEMDAPPLIQAEVLCVNMLLFKMIGKISDAAGIPTSESDT